MSEFSAMGLAVGAKDVNSKMDADPRNIAGLVFVILIGSLATTAGVGGGAIFVPLFQALIGFPLKESTALSQALITSGALVSVSINLFSPSPLDPKKPLIDFTLVLLLTPMVLVGVGSGLMFNLILPSYSISLVLLLLMAVMISQSLGKGVRMWQDENDVARSAADHITYSMVSGGERAGDAPAQQTSPLSHMRTNSKGLLGLKHTSSAGDLEEGSTTPPLPDLFLARGRQADSIGRASVQKAIPTETSPLLTQEAAASPVESPRRDARPGHRTISRQPSAITIQLRSNIASSGALRLLMVGGNHAELHPLLHSRHPSGDLPAAWTKRRNAWMWRFLHNCSEHVEVESAALQHSFVAAMAPHEARQGHTLSPSGMHRRCLSMPLQHQGPLLSADAMAAAVVPRRAWQRPDPDHWQLTAGRRDNSLLKLLVEAEAAPSRLVPDIPDSAAPALTPSYSSLWVHMRKGWARVPKPLLLLLTTCWTVNVALEVTNGLVTRCSVLYWSLMAAQIVVMLAFSVCVAKWLASEAKQQREDEEQECVDMLAGMDTEAVEREQTSGAAYEGDSPFAMYAQDERAWTAIAEDQQGMEEEEEGEVAASQPSLLLFQVFALVAGFLGGLLGLSGGTVVGLMLLELGVHPQIGAATSGSMVLISASTALATLASAGRLNLQYATAFSLASMVSALLGSLVIGGAIRRMGRSSLVVLALATVMILGEVAVGSFAYIEIMEAVRDGNFGLTHLCP